jgi:hypothetical protein
MRSVDEEGEDVAASRGDLLADDEVVRVVAGGVQLGGPQGAVDPLVVGDGDDVEIGPALDVIEDLGHRSRPVGVQGVDVHVGPPEIAAGARPGPGPSRADAAHVGAHRRSARSGQYGWKAPHHWSGASAMSCSMRSTSLPIRPATSARGRRWRAPR